MKAVQDFNYKVALASGLRHLQSKKLKQAEEQFRYLIAKFPQADSGYRGLARVQIDGGDSLAAVATLRDGASALARAGERAVAIELLREATTLDPRDLAAHRRLAAALALAGDVGAAAQEHVRFADAELGAGGEARARAEAAYALETIGEIPVLRELAQRLGLTLRTDDPLTLEARAVALLGARDPGAGRVAIDATRALLAAGKVQAASDLFLDIVASGISVHEAEREFVEVAQALGRGDLASERTRLLEEVRRLG